MTYDFIEKYSPKTIDDIVYPNAATRQQIIDIAHGNIVFPSAKKGILLYGKYGTGKTELAKLLADAIEYNKTGYSSNYKFLSIGSGNDGVKVVNSIKQQAMFVPYASSIHYFILDEVDRLKGDVMDSLKEVMNMPNCAFILTTNNPSAIEGGVMSRCIRIEFNQAPTSAWLVKVKSILNDNKLQVNDAELSAMIEHCKGDAREIIYATQSLIANALRKAA